MRDLNHWLNLVLNKKIRLAPFEILLGHLNNDNNFLPNIGYKILHFYMHSELKNAKF